MSGLIGIGQSALAAAYAQLQTTGQNIANVNTPGYVRQDVVLETGIAQYTGAGWLGSGVNVASIQRTYDAHLGRQVTQNQAFAGGDAARARMLGQLDDLLADTGNGLGVAMDDFRSALADVVNQPGDAGARQVAVSRAAGMAGRFRTTADQLGQLAHTVDLRLADGARQVNDDLAAIADLNRQIMTMNQAGKMPADLLDRRDLLIDSVASRMQVSRHDQADGSVTLLTANGVAAVVGTRPAQVLARQDPADPSRTEVAIQVGSSVIGLNAATLGGGELSGLLRFRDEDLASAQARVGQLAVAVAGAYNAAQAQGLDANGNTGQPLFSVGEPVAIAHPKNLGEAGIEVTVTDPSQVRGSDYRLRFDGSAYQLENLSDGTVQDLPALPAELGGLKLVMVGGTMTIGDSFTIKAASQFAAGMTATMTSGAGLATGYPSAVAMAATNAGSLATSAYTATAGAADAAAPVSIVFTSATTYNVTGDGTGNPTGLAYQPGQTISYNGWSLTLTGTPVLGDTVAISPTADPANDNRNARAMVALAEQPLADGATFNGAFGSLLADVGTRTARAEASATSSATLLTASREAFAATSGVNLDEEAARLLQYQQAYQAAAQVIATANSMFDTVLSVVRR